MRPAVDIVMLNRKEGVESWNCKYIPHGRGWNKSNAVPPIRAAGFKLETKRLTCGIPDDVLLLEDGAPLAEVNYVQFVCTVRRVSPLFLSEICYNASVPGRR